MIINLPFINKNHSGFPQQQRFLVTKDIFTPLILIQPFLTLTAFQHPVQPCQKCKLSILPGGKVFYLCIRIMYEFFQQPVKLFRVISNLPQGKLLFCVIYMVWHPAPDMEYLICL